MTQRFDPDNGQAFLRNNRKGDLSVLSEEDKVYIQQIIDEQLERRQMEHANRNLDGSSKDAVVQGRPESPGSKTLARSGPDYAALAKELAKLLCGDGYYGLAFRGTNGQPSWMRNEVRVAVVLQPFLERAASLQVKQGS